MKHFYREHSKITSPGCYQALFDALPEDKEQLLEIVQGLLLHRVDGHLLGVDIAEARLAELEIRTVENMLASILCLDNRPLHEARPPQLRLLSSCRNFAVLYCSFLRHKGIAARVRTGFSHYLFGGTQDHVLTEYWDNAAVRWKLADTRLISAYRRKAKVPETLEALDVQAPHFYLAGDIWLRCQYSQDQPSRYGYGLIRSIRGLRHIQDKVIQDLAALNKMELLPWDCWGYMVWDLPNVAPSLPEHIALIDRVSRATTAHELDLEKIIQLYQHPQLCVPEKIISASSVDGHKEVVLAEALR